ncbi:MAG: hypothetical protein HYW49_10035 [Deltaproteobacteria bacterium]|nr:hypothetical protein [Deltaproteobacteria bacterium]
MSETRKIRRKLFPIAKKTGAVASAHDQERSAEVLFQRLCHKWYAFSVVNDDCLMAEVSEEEIHKRAHKLPKNAA